MQRNSQQYTKAIKNTMLGGKYIFDVPIYDILSNPTYSNSFEFYEEKFTLNQNYKHNL